MRTCNIRTAILNTCFPRSGHANMSSRLKFQVIPPQHLARHSILHFQTSFPNQLETPCYEPPVSKGPHHIINPSTACSSPTSSSTLLHPTSQAASLSLLHVLHFCLSSFPPCIPPPQFVLWAVSQHQHTQHRKYRFAVDSGSGNL